jgi:hypothetical protein
MLVQCDASQLEWRTILQLAQDEVGIAEIVGGEDTHSKNEKAVNLPSRLIAKIYLPMILTSCTCLPLPSFGMT